MTEREEENARRDRQPDPEQGYSRVPFTQTEEGQLVLAERNWLDIVNSRMSMDDVIRMNGGRFR